MKTTLQRRLAILAGLVVLSMIVVATGAQVVQATLAYGSGAGAASTGQLVATSGQSQNSGSVNSGVTGPAQRGHGTTAVTTPTEGSSSTTAWIITGGVIAVLLVIGLAWAVDRRRSRSAEYAGASSRRSPSQTFCAQHPEDAACRAT